MRKVFKIEPGDVVWVMHNNIAVQGTVRKIWYSTFYSHTDFETVNEAESYYVYSGDIKLGIYNLDEMFKTKEDLLKSL